MTRIVFIQIEDSPKAWGVRGDTKIDRVDLEKNEQTPLEAYIRLTGEQPDLVLMPKAGGANEWTVEGDAEISSIAGRRDQDPLEAYDEIRGDLIQPITYQELRQPLYPAVVDQLDAVAKMGMALRNQGFEMPSDVNNWLDVIKGVKDKHPKPE